MKRINPLHGLLVLVFMIAACSKNSVKPNPGTGINLVLSSTEQQNAAADNAFTINLFKTVQTADKSGNNLFMSPLSVSFALGMASNGANGATLDAINNTLGFKGFTEDEVNAYYNKLITDLPKLDPQTTLNIANSIWYNQSVSILPQFLNTNSTNFNAKIQALDFNNPASLNTINNWVSGETNGKIPKIISELSGDDVMVLVNAIYFKSVWKTKFDASKTAKQAFYLPDQSTVQTDFMNGSKIDYNIYNDNNARVVELPYSNSKYSLVIITPNGGNTLKNLISALDTTTWQSWMTKLVPASGVVVMPKFKFSYNVLLNGALSALGMGNAFSNAADFTRINAAGGISITKVQHEAYIAVDESGTEAAAATGVVIGFTASAPTQPVTIDHPFLFAIREMKTGLILFAGTVNNPLQN